MKSLKLVFSALFVLALAASVPAQKIGFVDPNKAVFTCAEGKAESAKINEWAKKKDEEIQDMQKRLSEKQTKMQTGQNALADAEKEKLLREMDELDTKIKRQTEDVKKEYARRIDEFGGVITQKMTQLFNDYAKKNSYSVVLYLNPQVIAYFDQTTDITDDIIKLYDQTFPYSPAAAKPAGDGK